MNISKITLFLFFFGLLSHVANAQDVLPGRDDSVYNIIKNNPKLIDLKSMSLADALIKYPSPSKKTEFDVTGPLGAGRNILYSVFPEYHVKKRKFKHIKPVYIKEVTWELDSVLNMTIWYKEDSLNNKPVLDRVWYKGTLF